MEVLVEQIVIYGTVFILIGIAVFFYVRKQVRNSRIVEEKIAKAREAGLHEPVSLHPVVDPKRCIQTGACILACPEGDILGIKDGLATTINASRCVGHGACFHACPTQAITLCIGTEKRGVDLPHVNQRFESNISGLFIAGELGGMGLIKNAVEQGKQAVENMLPGFRLPHQTDVDLAIVGAGPAGVSGALTAKKHGIKSVILEQDTLGGTVYTFPRTKIIMTSPMDLPLVGKVKLYETKKSELLKIWQKAIAEHQIEVREQTKVENIIQENGHFRVVTNKGEELTAFRVLLAIGRRGSPRKLNVPGEQSEKVAYRLLEPEHIQGKKVLVVGGGDSAVESAMLLADNNEVTLSYRKDKFQRIKPGNFERIHKAIEEGRINVLYNTQVKEIKEKEVVLKDTENSEEIVIANDLVYIFAGGELPTQFLNKIGLKITTRFGDAILSHDKKQMS
ncbi:MAG: hypothetical protein Kow00127_13780 [Bacteroidales bacterium]